MDDLLRLSEEVQDACAEGAPLVALESTLLTHGLPSERADDVAEVLEADVRSQGAVPATIALINGDFVVGLNAADRARLLEGPTRKASVRDLAVASVRGGLWSTTVAATATIAHRVGVRLFATGGIGGVHRGAEHSYDESADLTVLSRVPVAVVSAGVKAVLDLPRTAERLETLGVPVVGYRCDELPAFYYARSGLSLTIRVESTTEIAAMVGAQLDHVGGGILVVQPPPRAIEASVIEAQIEDAVASAARQGIRGGDVTPHLLAALRVASEGDVIDVNIELVRANATLAAQIAVADRARVTVRRSPT